MLKQNIEEDLVGYEEKTNRTQVVVSENNTNEQTKVFLTLPEPNQVENEFLVLFQGVEIAPQKKHTKRP